jgi:Domain of unknown function (DUF4939)
MADTASVPASSAPSVEMTFDGNPVDLERILAHLSVLLLLRPAAFDSDSKRSAFVASSFRGDALDWMAETLSADSKVFDDFEKFKKMVKARFGMDAARRQIMAYTELQELKQGGEDLLLFLCRFEGTCSRAGITSDVTKLLLITPKLDSYFAEAMRTSTQALSTWIHYRDALHNLYMRRPSTTANKDKKRKKSKCGKCGKKGHTATECRSEN